MTKRLKSKHKVDRRLKANIWGRPKSPFNSRAYPPGQHGQNKKGKPTDYGIQLQAKQKLKAYYKINGAIYITNLAKLKSKESLFLKENSYAYIMDSKKSVDIDTFDDLRYAEYLIKSNVSQNNS